MSHYRICQRSTVDDFRTSSSSEIYRNPNIERSTDTDETEKESSKHLIPNLVLEIRVLAGLPGSFRLFRVRIVTLRGFALYFSLNSSSRRHRETTRQDE